ncbi:MAG: transposase, partial [Candidatus Acidiferrales bacterium]
IRRWQRNEGAGTSVEREALRKLERQLGSIPARIERLKKAGVKKLSRVDQDCRFLRELDAVERECGERPGQASGDSGFFSLANVQAREERKIDGYVPDTNMARVLNRGGRPKQHACHPAHRRMRRKLRSPAGRAAYRRRKELVEPIFGVLKEQRGMRRFRMRGLSKVAIEFTLAATALNLTRLWRMAPQLS